MTQLFANNISTLTVGSLTIGATSITLPSGITANLPTITAPDYLLMTLHNDSFSEWEVVQVTAVAGDVLTVTRGYEGTAQVWPDANPISANLTKATMDLLTQNAQNAYDQAVIAAQDAYNAVKIATDQITGYTAQANAGEFNQPYLGPSAVNNHHDLMIIDEASGAAYSADFTDTQARWVTLDQACTITPTGLDWSTGTPKQLVRHRLLINTETFAVTWAGVDAWIGGAPTLANNTTSIIEFWSPDNGVTVIGEAIADGLTEITQPAALQYAYTMGGTGAPTNNANLMKFNLINETYYYNQYGLYYGCNNPMGAVSDRVKQGWYSTGDSDENIKRILSTVSLYTGASTTKSRQLGLSHYGMYYSGSPGSPYDDAGATNNEALIAAGYENGTPLTTMYRVDLSTESGYTTSSINLAMGNMSGCSDTVNGHFIGMDYRFEIPWATKVSSSNWNASYTTTHVGMGNDQSAKAVFYGGSFNGTNPIANTYELNMTTKAWTTGGALQSSSMTRQGFGSTDTYGYVFGRFSSTSVKYTFSTSTRAANPINTSWTIQNTASFTDFTRN